MAMNDPVLERIAVYPWPRGGIVARRMNRGYSLFSARTGAPVARLRPLGEGDRVEVLWWRRDAWGPAATFGAVFDLDSGSAPEGLLSHNAQSRGAGIYVKRTKQERYAAMVGIG